MSDWSELKRLAEAATPGPYFIAHANAGARGWEVGAVQGRNQVGADMTEANANFFGAATPEAVLALIAENEQLRNGLHDIAKKASESRSLTRRLTWIEGRAESALLGKPWAAHVFMMPDPKNGKPKAERLESENKQLKAENELARMRIKELDLLFGRYILAMRSAVIEEEHGKGPAAAMEWIYNSLAGPGELPPEGETESQSYFDREIVAVDRGMSEIMEFHRARRAAVSQGEKAGG